MTHPPETPAQAPKKINPLVWVAVGCVALIVIGGVIMAGGLWFAGKKVAEFAEEAEANPALTAARAIAAFNPEIELVEEESDQARITFRNTETGEIFVINAEDVKNGRVSFESAEGTMTIDAQAEGDGGEVTITTEEGQTVFRGGETAADDVPAWVPRYPGAEVTGAYATVGSNGVSGLLSQTTSDSPRQVLDHYRELLAAEGYEIQVQTMSGAGEGLAGMVIAEHEGSGRSLRVTAGVSDGETQAAVHYSGGG